MSIDLYHEVRGHGPAVLFIAGATGDAGHYTRVAERLADEFTVITYDRRGNSRSRVNADGPQVATIAAQADAEAKSRPSSRWAPSATAPPMSWASTWGRSSSQ